MDKRLLVEELASRLRASALTAAREGALAAEMALEGATPAERREDSRIALEYGSLAKGQTQRALRARAELETLDRFRPAPFVRGARISLGAIVEVEGEEGQGRTFFLAPVGAGVELHGPDGDGFLSVVTPASPLGRAVVGRRVGETVDVTIDGEVREWTITFVE